MPTIVSILFWREMTCTYVSAIKHCFDSVWKFSSGRNSLFTSFLYAFRCNELRCLSCFTDSPAVVSQSSLLASAPGTPDLLVNSLELKRTLRKWSHDKEKVKEDGIIGDCFLVDICFSPSRSSQVNPNSTRSIAWALEGFFASARVRRESSSDATGHNKDVNKDLTQTGNRACNVFGTQGTRSMPMLCWYVLKR